MSPAERRYRIPSLRTILNGTNDPSSNVIRANIASTMAFVTLIVNFVDPSILQSPSEAGKFARLIIPPVIFIFETLRQSILEFDKKKLSRR